MKNWANRKRNGFNHAESTAITNQEFDEINSQYTWVKVHHEWFSWYDEKQKIVQYAYDLWWENLVYLIECENGNWNTFAIGDSWKAYWLCQINTNYHKLDNWFFDDWKVQVDQCARLMKWWTKFYWPSRIVKWVRCSEYVKKRFTFTE